jgi:hypothetical protein
VEPPGFEGHGGNGGLGPNGGWGEGGAVGAGLAAVPAFYFEGTFRLGDLATFERTGAATEDAEAARLLQEHLSEHLDTVEHVLMREIQARSHAFYRALDTLHQLYSQVCVCVTYIYIYIYIYIVNDLLMVFPSLGLGIMRDDAEYPLHVSGFGNNASSNTKRYINPLPNVTSNTTLSILVVANFVGYIWCSSGTIYVSSNERIKEVYLMFVMVTHYNRC